MDLSFRNNWRSLVTITGVMLMGKLCTFYYWRNFVFVLAAILMGFQAKSQSEESLLQLKNSYPKNRHDSIYYELFKMHRTSDTHKAKHYAQNALLLSSKCNHFLLQAKACRAIAYLYDVSNQTDSSTLFYRKAIQIASTHNFTDRLIDIYNDLGLLHERLDVYDSALYYFMLSYTLAAQTNSYQQQAIATYNIGIVYSYLDNYTEALAHFKEAVRLKKNNGINEGLNTNLINLASIFNQQGLYTDAIGQLTEVETNCKNGCDGTTLADLYYGLGYSTLKSGLSNKAYTYFVKALALATKNNNRQTTANTLFHLSFFAADRKEYAGAVAYLQQAETVAKEINHRRLLKDIYNQLASVYIKMGDANKAIYNIGLYQGLKDSIFNKTIANNLKNIQLGEQRKQSDEVIQKKDVALHEKDKALSKSNIIAILLAINCVLAFTIVYLVYRSFKAGRRAKKVMENEMIKLVNEHEKSQKELSRSHMEFSYLLNRVTGFLMGPIATLLGLSNVSKDAATLEEAKEYLNKIRQICGKDITGVFQTLTELRGIRDQVITLEQIDLNILSEHFYKNSKHSNKPTSPLVTLQKSVAHTLYTDKSLLTALLGNAVGYFGYKNVKPLEVVFDQYDTTTTITVKSYSATPELIPYENLFHLFAAQVTAWKLKGDTLLAERNDYTILKIFIPTDFTIFENMDTENKLLRTKHN